MTSAPGCATRPADRSICASVDPPDGAAGKAARMDDAFRRGRSSTAPIGGAKPGPNAEVDHRLSGLCRRRRRSQAAGRIGEDRRDIGVLGGDLRRPAECRLAPRRMRARRKRGNDRGHEPYRSVCCRRSAATLHPDHRDLTAIRPPSAGSARSWGIRRTVALGVEHFGQTGTSRRSLPAFRDRRRCHRRHGPWPGQRPATASSRRQLVRDVA